MSLEQASFLAQIISAVAVVASLIFVGVQLRQTARTVRTSTSQAHSTVYHAIIGTIIDNADFARIWRQMLADPKAGSDDDWVRFVAYASALFRYFEVSRVQWLRSQLDEEHWQNIEQQAISLGAQPGMKLWWTVRRHWHSGEFRAWFEGLPKPDVEQLYGRPMTATTPPAPAEGDAAPSRPAVEPGS
jgi:hypothetical protein